MTELEDGERETVHNTSGISKREKFHSPCNCKKHTGKLEWIQSQQYTVGRLLSAQMTGSACYVSRKF